MQPTLTKPERSSQAFKHCGLEGVGVLVGLGLSERQARVYLALLRAGGGRAQVVSDLTAISRQDIYRLFAELQRLGLARQNLTVPVSYTATPIAQGAQLLLERKTEELTTITAKANQLTRNSPKPPPQSQLRLSPVLAKCSRANEANNTKSP